MMTSTDNHHRESRNVVDEVRTARAAVENESGGLTGLGEYLRRIQEENRARTGRFAGVPASRPEEVQRLIDAAEVGDPLLDEIRAAKGGRAENGGTARR